MLNIAGVFLVKMSSDLVLMRICAEDAESAQMDSDLKCLEQKQYNNRWIFWVEWRSRRVRCALLLSFIFYFFQLRVNSRILCHVFVFSVAEEETGVPITLVLHVGRVKLITLCNVTRQGTRNCPTSTERASTYHYKIVNYHICVCTSCLLYLLH